MERKKPVIEERVLSAIREHYAETGFMPLQKEIGYRVGVCRAIVIRGLEKLEKQGRIRRRGSQTSLLISELQSVTHKKGIHYD